MHDKYKKEILIYKKNKYILRKFKKESKCGMI